MDKVKYRQRANGRRVREFDAILSVKIYGFIKWENRNCIYFFELNNYLNEQVLYTNNICSRV